jgi:hypothetical protein
VITCSPGRVGADRFLPSTCNSGFGKGGHTGRSDDGDLQERPRCIDVGRRMERQVGFSITLDFDRPELGPILSGTSRLRASPRWWHGVRWCFAAIDGSLSVGRRRVGSIFYRVDPGHLEPHHWV